MSTTAFGGGGATVWLVYFQHKVWCACRSGIIYHNNVISTHIGSNFSNLLVQTLICLNGNPKSNRVLIEREFIQEAIHTFQVLC